jgi:hypothetical protein
MIAISWSTGRSSVSRIAFVAGLVTLASLPSCGGGSSSPAPAPTPTPVPSTAWSVSGQVKSQVGQAIGGANVTPFGLAQVQTDSSGNYKYTGNSPTANNPYSVQISASGYLQRGVWVNYQLADRTGVSIDMISTAPPFSLTFYQQLARNAMEEPGSLEALWPWAGDSPKFYVRTVDQNGKAIEPEVLSGVYAAIPKAVSDWSSGKFTVSTLEHGIETRPRQDGWIVIDFTRDYSSDFCGRAFVGAPDGHIELVDDRCNCGSNKMPGQVVAHEIGHAMGFWHVSDRGALMYPQASATCPAGVLTGNERYHAKIVYGRARGNADPDADPDGGLALERAPLLIAN